MTYILLTSNTMYDKKLIIMFANLKEQKSKSHITIVLKHLCSLMFIHTEIFIIFFCVCVVK